MEVRSILPAVAPLKAALAQPPQLVLLHVSGSGLDERRRIRTLLEALGRRWPLVLVSKSGDSNPATAAIQALVMEFKVDATLNWNPNKGLFTRRLLQGLIQKHWEKE